MINLSLKIINYFLLLIKQQNKKDARARWGKYLLLDSGAGDDNESIGSTLTKKFHHHFKLKKK